MRNDSSRKQFELWFPWSPEVVGINETELGRIHNRPFAEVLASIAQSSDWDCEQCYLTNGKRGYAARGTVINRFFPVSLRRRASSRSYARQWSLAALRSILLWGPDAAAIFSAYGLFAKALALCCRIRRTPYIVIVGGWYNRISRSQRWYFDHAFRVLVHTEMQKQELIRVGYRPDNIEIFPLGIDTAVFSAKPDYEWRDNSPRLLYVGRLQPSKGPMEALLAFKAVKENFPNASLQIVGPCNDELFLQSLINYVHDYGLKDAVEFAGPIAYEKLPRFYQQADIFLFPSPYEGLPSVVLESMACGTPPVVLRGSGGTEEAVAECGWVIDMPQLAYNLVQLLADRNEVRRRGQHAARRAREFYSASRTYDILLRLLGDSTRARLTANAPAYDRPLTDARHQNS